MNSIAKQAVHNFLVTNKLNPEERPSVEGTNNWLFNITENLQSELFFYEGQTNDITGLLITSVQIPVSDNATTLASALAPSLVPATIVHTGEVLSLRLTIRGNAQTIPGLLEEGILISRHIITAVFPRIIELAEGKIPIQNAMMLAMEALQGGKGPAAANP